MQVITTIIPIFSVIALGYIAKAKGFIVKDFLGPANRIVFYLALPALIFNAVSKASFQDDFNAVVLLLTLLSTICIYFCGWVIAKFTNWRAGRIGSFIQCVGHGNHGYIGLPIALYYLGNSGFAKAAIIAGFLFVLQHILSVLAMQVNGAAQNTPGNSVLRVAKKLIGNPIILSAFAGMGLTFLGLTIPGPLLRFLEIMSGMAAPMSLLLIGASLSFTLIRKNLLPVFGAATLKLIVLPLFGLVLFSLSGEQMDDYLPALILLATPTASVTYILAGEMGGDCDFTAAAISAGTICSALTYVLWLTVAS